MQVGDEVPLRRETNNRESGVRDGLADICNVITGLPGSVTRI